ncbi:MAG: hypothetical protein ACFCBW_10510 [Candidatus Competibacterales bacterium]
MAIAPQLTVADPASFGFLAGSSGDLTLNGAQLVVAPGQTLAG